MPDKLRTKKEILDALIGFMDTAPFEEITVKEICEHAQISRQTFYRYFKDKYDVSVWYVMENVSRYFSLLGDTLGWRDAYLELFRRIEMSPDGEIWMSKTDDYNSIVNSTIRSSRSDFTNAYIRRYGEEPTPLIAYQIDRYSITASLATNDWLVTHCAIPADSFVDYFITLIPGELFHALDIPANSVSDTIAD